MTSPFLPVLYKLSESLPFLVFYIFTLGNKSKCIKSEMHFIFTFMDFYVLMMLLPQYQQSNFFVTVGG